MLCRWMMGNLYGSKKSSIFWLPVLHLGFSLFLSHIHTEREAPGVSCYRLTQLYAGQVCQMVFFAARGQLNDAGVISRHCARFRRPLCFVYRKCTVFRRDLIVSRFLRYEGNKRSLAVLTITLCKDACSLSHVPHYSFWDESSLC